VEKTIIDLHGIDYAVVDQGTGPAVLLLHGFPDTSDLWRRQVPTLVGAGFRVIAPDLRGFGDSGKPVGVEEYRLTKVLADMSALMRALGVHRAYIVGHDWGAVVAWLMGALMRQKVERLVVLSVGHPSVYQTPSIEQREKSWYMLLYQFEGVAEELLRRHNWRLFRAAMGEHGEVDRYIAELSKPGSLTAALNWYRANRSPAAELSPPPNLPFVMCPTMGVWSTGDGSMLEEGMLESAMFVKGEWRYERIEGASHWIPTSAPGRLNELLLEFLGSPGDMSQEPVRRRRRL
jgi:pimeloyl-ACP methyl ester carboxylesterase